MAHGEAPEAAEGFRGEPRGEPRGEHGGEAEPGTQLSMDAMRRVRKFACYMWEGYRRHTGPELHTGGMRGSASSHVICGTRDQSSYVKCGKARTRI